MYTDTFSEKFCIRSYFVLQQACEGNEIRLSIDWNETVEISIDEQIRNHDECRFTFLVFMI